MALTERTEEDQVEIVGEFRQIQVRTALIIEDGGVEISREFSRRVLPPDADVTGERQLVRDLAAGTWTQEVKDAWAAFKAAGPSL